MTLPLSDKTPAGPLDDRATELEAENEHLRTFVDELIEARVRAWKERDSWREARADSQKVIEELVAAVGERLAGEDVFAAIKRLRAAADNGREAELVVALLLLWNACEPGRYLSGSQMDTVAEMLARIKGGSDDRPAQW